MVTWSDYHPPLLLLFTVVGQHLLVRLDHAIQAFLDGEMAQARALEALYTPFGKYVYAFSQNKTPDKLIVLCTLS